jgi:hypothetical protein
MVRQSPGTRSLGVNIPWLDEPPLYIYVAWSFPPAATHRYEWLSECGTQSGSNWCCVTLAPPLHRRGDLWCQPTRKAVHWAQRGRDPLSRAARSLAKTRSARCGPSLALMFSRVSVCCATRTITLPAREGGYHRTHFSSKVLSSSLSIHLAAG